MDELVDILVTTYNTNEKYLKKQIESILKQTYKNIKVYISDDNSADPKIAEILKKYKEQDERIELYIQPKNLGYNKNFEFLLKQSQSNYIMFSDHDDIWNKDKVEKSLKRLKEKDVDMVYCNCRQIDEDGIVLHDDYFKYKNVPLVEGKSKLAISRCVGIGCSQIITKKIKDKMIPFKSNFIAHDWLSAFIANEENGISYIKEPLFDYRLHATNVFGGRSLNQNLSRWKQEHGQDYKSFVEYRKDAINRAYLGGIKMCKEYVHIKSDEEFIKEAERYYNNLLESTKINWNLKEFFKILSGKNQGKKMIREIVLFHFPVLGYLKFRI